jgi:hypothetical protein
LVEEKRQYTPVRGKTYTLFAARDDTEHYYAQMKQAQESSFSLEQLEDLLL